jgi:hypothetical protein
VGRLRVGLPHAEFFDLKPAALFDHRVKDPLHQVRINQMAFGFDDFLEHEFSG